jgi:cellulose synthase/poly-beta-1,6-N-acetylglucosamine synthase-like glycosyltransferase
MSISGDDDLFIQLVRHQTDWKIGYSTSSASFVRTAPPETFMKFIEQRTRHFSAGKYFTLRMKSFFFLFHSSNLILLLGLFTAIFSVHIFLIALIGFLIKLVCDLVLTLVAMHAFGQTKLRPRFQLSNFLLTEILYIFYNTLIGPLGFFKTFKWKQDKIN